MATKQVFHIEVDEESDYSTRFLYADTSTGLPIDLTGYRAEMQVRREYNGATYPIVELAYTSEPGGGIVLGGPAGTVDLFISYEDTTTKLWDRGSYDLFIISPYGARSKFTKGFFTINKSASRLVNTALPDISLSKPNPYVQPNNYDVGGLNKVEPLPLP